MTPTQDTPHRSISLRPRTLLIVIAAVCLTLLLTGCPGGKDPVTAIFDNAINTLAQQSADWQKTLNTTREELIKAGQTTLATEVQQTLSRAVGDVGAEVFCGVDYFRNRVREDLVRIRAVYTGEKITLIPHFCNVSPPQIDMSLEPSRRSSILIYGWNLKVASVQVFLINNTGQETDVTNNSSGVSNFGSATDYLMTLNLGGNGVALDNTSKQLRFRLSDADTQTVNIIQPVVPIGVHVNVHVQNMGWLGWMNNPDSDTNFAGPPGKNAQIEAIQVKLLNAPAGMKICYQAAGQGYTWQSEACDGATAGTTGQGARLETLRIRLDNAPAGIHVSYRGLIYQQPAWLPWQTDGTDAGTIGRGLPLVGINVKITGQ